jgi:hypothetical protein
MDKLLMLVLVFVLGYNNGFASGDHKKHSNSDGHDHKKHHEDDGRNHEKHSKDDGHDHMKHSDDDGHDHSKHSDHDHKHGGGKAIGEKKAIIQVDEKKGFKLSKEAIKTLKLKLKTVDGDEFKISKSTLVASKNSKGVYRFRDGFFKLLPAKILKKTNKEYHIKVSGVEFGDQIVINGVGLLRVSDVYSTDKSEYGHSH